MKGCILSSANLPLKDCVNLAAYVAPMTRVTMLCIGKHSSLGIHNSNNKYRADGVDGPQEMERS